jgi:hypothetical protein
MPCPAVACFSAWEWVGSARSIDSIGVPYRECGKRIDEGIEAIRALWKQTPATHHGRFCDFSRVRSDPQPARKGGVPILVGGSTEMTARRAGRVGDGFFPHAVSSEDFAARIEVAREAAKEAGRDPAQFELTAASTGWRLGASMDFGIMKAYAELCASRLVMSAREAMSIGLADIERFVKSCRGEVIAKL